MENTKALYTTSALLLLDPLKWLCTRMAEMTKTEDRRGLALQYEEGKHLRKWDASTADVRRSPEAYSAKEEQEILVRQYRDAEEFSIDVSIPRNLLRLCKEQDVRVIRMSVGSTGRILHVFALASRKVAKKCL